MESANADYLPSNDNFTIEIELDHIARWDVYFRLQELSVPCKCKFNRPLQVQVDSANTALQLWSLVRAFTSTKQQCTEHLEHCWQQTFTDPLPG
ncbi:MAG: Asr1405/Asl0597 family protein [Cyanobacteria bacterium P01_H01_bin.58]